MGGIYRYLLAISGNYTDIPFRPDHGNSLGQYLRYSRTFYEQIYLSLTSKRYSVDIYNSLLQLHGQGIVRRYLYRYKSSFPCFFQSGIAIMGNSCNRYPCTSGLGQFGGHKPYDTATGNHHILPGLDMAFIVQG